MLHTLSYPGIQLFLVMHGAVVIHCKLFCANKGGIPLVSHL